MFGASVTVLAACDAKADAGATKYTGTAYFQAWASDKKMTDEAKHYMDTGNFKTPDSDAKKAFTEKALGTADTLTADNTAGKASVLTGSTITYASDGLKLNCTIKAKHADADLSTNQVAWEYMSKALTAAASKNSVVSYQAKDASGACKGKDLSVTVEWTAIPAGKAVATAHTKNAGAASALADMLSGTHTVTTWTDAKVAYVNFTFQTVLKAAIQKDKLYQMATCTQIATAVWTCAAMYAKGTAANQIEYIYKAYTGSVKPTGATADKALDDSTNLGKTATFTQTFAGKSATGCTTSCAQNGTTVDNRVDGLWAWDTDNKGNNLSTDFKTINGNIQYFSTEADDAAATKVGTTAKDYAIAGAYVGSYSDVDSKGKWADVKMTATVAGGASALSLAAAGLALAMAF